MSLRAWQTLFQSVVPIGIAAHIQRNWDTACIVKCNTDLMKGARDQQDLARILASQASQAAHSVDWLYAMSISSLGLRFNNEAIRVTIGLCLRTKLCEKHDCPCGSTIDMRGLTVCCVARVQDDINDTS